MARKYARDNRGRFAGGGGGATARGGRLRTASGGKRKTVTAKLKSPATAGVVGRRQPKAKARAANKIVKTGRLRGTDKRPANAIRRGPKSPDTRLDRALRNMSDTIKDAQPKLRAARKDLEQMNRQIERSFARPFEDRVKNNVDARLSTIYQKAYGSSGIAAGKDVIRRRAQRAAKAAGRGSKAAKKALGIYDRQLAWMPSGSTKAANNIAPGRGRKPKGKGKGPGKGKRKRKPKD